MVLLFDLDGTLSDSRQGIVRCTRHALEQLGERVPSDDALAAFIGPPLRSMFGTLLSGEGGEAGGGAAGSAGRGRRVEDAVRLYRERYDAVGLYEARLYDGVARMLEGAAARASRLFVATAKPRTFAVRVVEHLGISPFFAGIYGAELDGRFDAKEELIRHLLEEEGVAPGEALMVGDRGVDVLAARANGVPAIGALWGYGSADELEEAGAIGLCESPAGLETCLAGAGEAARSPAPAGAAPLPWRPQGP